VCESLIFIKYYSKSLFQILRALRCYDNQWERGERRFCVCQQTLTALMSSPRESRRSF